jgi:hypothetical protein
VKLGAYPRNDGSSSSGGISTGIGIQQLQTQRVDASPVEQANIISRAMHDIREALDSTSSLALDQRTPFEGGYQFGDVSRKVFRWFSRTN